MAKKRPREHFIHAQRFEKSELKDRWPENIHDFVFERCVFDRVDFRHLAFKGCKFEGCEFSKCKMQEAGFYDCEFLDSRFSNCDCRDLRLGLGYSIFHKATICRGVVFEQCNFRDTIPGNVDFLSCKFIDCKLYLCDFLGGVFKHCEFVGDLDGAIFRRKGWDRWSRRNRMEGCDFHKADVSMAAFHKINLDLSQFCLDDRIIVLPRGKRDLEDWRDALRPGLTEGGEAYLRLEIGSAGAPSFLASKILRDAFTKEQVDVLMAIVSGKKSS